MQYRSADPLRRISPCNLITHSKSPVSSSPKIILPSSSLTTFSPAGPPLMLVQGFLRQTHRSRRPCFDRMREEPADSRAARQFRSAGRFRLPSHQSNASPQPRPLISRPFLISLLLHRQHDTRTPNTHLELASMLLCSCTGAGAFFSPEVAAMAIAAVERIVPRALSSFGQRSY